VFLQGTRAATGSEIVARSPSMATPLFQQASLRDNGLLQIAQETAREKIFNSGPMPFPSKKRGEPKFSP